MWYYQQIAPVDVVSRFTQGYAQHVASQLGVEVTPLTGPAGGGFLFDTNALHRGMHDSGTEESRTAVILEFHAHGKIAGLRGHDGPCPSAAPQRNFETFQSITDGTANCTTCDVYNETRRERCSPSKGPQ